eukprot:129940-Rhodomonas_salina.1
MRACPAMSGADVARRRPDDTQAKMTALIGFLKEQKITTFSMLGFCYGAYPIAKTIADKSMWKVSSARPTHSPVLA